MLFEDVFDDVRPDPGPTPGDAVAVLRLNELQLVPLSAQVQASIHRHDLDDYGTFRVVVEAIDQLPIAVDHSAPLRAVGQAVHAGAWSADGRLLAVAALLRVLDVNVVPQRRSDGHLLIAVPVGDDPKRYNSNLQTAKVQVRRNGRPEEVVFRWLLWDGEGPLGSPREGGEILLGLKELIQGPPRALHLARRRLPDVVLSPVAPMAIPVHGHPLELAVLHRPGAQAYLEHYPALTFARQVQHAVDELATLELAASLAALRDLDLSEVELVEALLRTVQSHVTYVEGPLRSLYAILDSRTGDCDQLSLLLAALLHSAGWSLQELVQMSWPGHIALGVRTRDGHEPDDGLAFDVKDRGRFVALDGAFLHTTDGEVTTRWGHLNQRYSRLGFGTVLLG